MLGLTDKYLPSTFFNLYGWIEPLVIIISCQQPTFKDILPSSNCPDGNALIRPVGADIANPDLKTYQGLTLVSPGVDAQGGLNPKVHDIREVGAGRCQDQVLA
jgi:hypothetical protein